MDRTNDEEISRVLTSESPNATNINPKDASYTDQPAKYRNYGLPTYQKLSRYNRGWNGPKRENKKVTHNQDNLAIFDALAGQVSLTDYQKRKGRGILRRLNLGEIGKTVKLIAFSTCILVSNDDVNDGVRYWPRAKGSDEEYKRLQRNLGLDDDAVLSAINTVANRRGEFDV